MKRHIKILSINILLFFSLSIYGQTTIMTFNIRLDTPIDKENRWEKRKMDVIDLIEFYHPDFLGIQEGIKHQVEFIKENATNYDFVGIGRSDGKKKEEEYTAIYYDTTKFKLIRSETFWLSETPKKFSVGWDAALERICTYGIFRNLKTLDSIYIFNVHFDHRGIEARKMSAKLIVNKIDEFQLDDKNVIVMGDLNCEPQDEPIQILKDKLDDGVEISLKKFYGPKGTFNQFDTKIILDKKIDYILTKNIKVLNYRHIDDKRPGNLWVSDHLPVLIQINDLSTRY